jgi:hypothetical protein
MITTKDGINEDMIFIIQSIQAFGASGNWKARHYINLSDAPFFHLAFNSASLDKWLEKLWLIKSSNQRPNLHKWNWLFRKEKCERKDKYWKLDTRSTEITQSTSSYKL